MLRNSRNCILDICDLARNKICPLYDNSVDVQNYADNIFVTTQRNGWKTISFNLYSSDEEELQNFIMQYIKAEYNIRLIDDNGTDYFTLNKPKITHTSGSKKASITADHCSAILKYRRLDLEFSNEKLNNTGTAEELLTTILDGTGWSVGEVYEFREKWDNSIKYRTFSCSAKTGAFNMISKMCDLFEAKPIYHGDERTVDIIPLNPFTKDSIDEETGIPSLELASGVLEMTYGVNVKGITKTEDSDKITDKLYVYGTYGDAKNEMCSIYDLKHNCYRFIATASSVVFQITNPFNPSLKYVNVSGLTVGDECYYSLIDRQSMSYVYVPDDEKAYQVTLTAAGTTSGYNNMQITEDKNWVSYIMDFTYYEKNGMLTGEQLDAIAKYQYEAPIYTEQSYIYNLRYINDWNSLYNLMGGTKFVKLDIDNTEVVNNNLVIHLTDDEIVYRTDYTEVPENYFEWRIANEIKPNGLPVNSAAAIIYINHGNYDRAYEKMYIKSISGTPRTLTLWGQPKSSFNTDEFYLFDSNSINGDLGGLESAQESMVESANSSDSGNYPIYFKESIDASLLNNFTEYGWLIVSSPSTSPVLYFCYKPDGDSLWQKTYIGNTQPDNTYAYWYDESKAIIKKRGIGNTWNVWFDKNDTADNEWSRRNNVFYKFATVHIYIDQNEEYWKGKYEQYKYTLSSNLPIGDYYFEDMYNNAYLFTTDRALVSGDTLLLNTTKKWITPAHTSTSEDLLNGVSWTNVTLDQAGLEIESILYKTSDYFEVDDNSIYQINAGTSLYSINWYNSDKLNIGYNKFTSPASSQSVASKANAKYARFSCLQSVTNPSIISSMTNYLDLTASVVKTYTMEKHKENILENISWESGDLNSATGTIIDDNTKQRTNFVAAYGNTYYHLLNSGASCSVYFYTSKSTFISKSDLTYGSSVLTPAKCCNIKIVKAANAVIQFGVVDYSNYLIEKDNSYNKQYKKLATFTNISEHYGELIGLYSLSKNLFNYADATYITDLTTVREAQQDLIDLESDLTDVLGEIYKENFWQDSSYIEGMEKQLYFDAIDKLDDAAKPVTTYDIQYLDLYGTDEDDDAKWPDIDPNYAIHIIDEKLDVEKWAYIETLKKCYDMPKKTTLTVNTNLTDSVANKTYSDLMTEFADVSSNVKANEGVVKSVTGITSNGEIVASKISGAIDTAKTAINNANSSWYTDDKGNIIFVAANGSSAMKLCGSGFAIANSTDQWGEWQWKTFGTGDGFTADLINAGTIRANLIEAGSITADKVSSTFGATLDISSNKEVSLFATVDGTRPAGSVNVGQSFITINALTGITMGADADINMTSNNAINMNGSEINVSGNSKVSVASQGALNLVGENINIGTTGAGAQRGVVNVNAGDVNISAASTFTASDSAGNTFALDGNGATITGETIKFLTGNNDSGELWLGSSANKIYAKGLISLNNGSLILDGTSTGNGKVTTSGEMEISGGTINVNSDGAVNINSGTLTATSNGEIVINGGSLTATAGDVNITSGSTLTINSDNLKVNTNPQDPGSVEITGAVYASSGRIGCNSTHNGGWLITSDEISSGSGDYTVGLSSKSVVNYSQIATWDSSTTYHTGDKVKVKLKQEGTVVWRVYIAKSNNTNKKPNTTTGTSYWKVDPDYIAYWAGDDDPETAPFRVYRDGTVTLTMLERYNEQQDTTEIMDIRSSLWMMETAYARSVTDFIAAPQPDGTITLKIHRQGFPSEQDLSVNFRRASDVADYLITATGVSLNPREFSIAALDSEGEVIEGTERNGYQLETRLSYSTYGVYANKLVASTTMSKDGTSILTSVLPSDTTVVDVATVDPVAYSMTFTPTANIGDLSITGSTRTALVTVYAQGTSATSYASVSGTITFGSDVLTKTIRLYPNAVTSISGNTLNIRSYVQNDDGTSKYASSLITKTIGANNTIGTDSANYRLMFTPVASVGTDNFSGTTDYATLNVYAQGTSATSYANVSGTITSGSNILTRTIRMYPNASVNASGSNLIIIAKITDDSTGTTTYASKQFTKPVTATISTAVDLQNRRLAFTPNATVDGVNVPGGSPTYASPVYSIEGSSSASRAVVNATVVSGSNSVSTPVYMYPYGNIVIGSDYINIESCVADNEYGSIIYASTSRRVNVSVSNTETSDPNNYRISFTPNAAFGSSYLSGTTNSVDLGIAFSGSAATSFATISGTMYSGHNTITRSGNFYPTQSVSVVDDDLLVSSYISDSAAGTNKYASVTTTMPISVANNITTSGTSVTATPTVSLGSFSGTGTANVFTLDKLVSAGSSADMAMITSKMLYNTQYGDRTVTIDTALYAIATSQYANHTLSLISNIANSRFASEVYATSQIDLAVSISDGKVIDTENERIILTPTTTIGTHTETANQTIVTLMHYIDGDGSNNYATFKSGISYSTQGETPGSIINDIVTWAVVSANLNSDNDLIVGSKIANSSTGTGTVYAAKYTTHAFSTDVTVTTDAQNYALKFTPGAYLANIGAITGSSSSAVITVAAGEGSAANIATITGTMTSGARSIERAINVYANGNFSVVGSSIVFNANVTADSEGQTVLATKAIGGAITLSTTTSDSQQAGTITVLPVATIGGTEIQGSTGTTVTLTNEISAYDPTESYVTINSTMTYQGPIRTQTITKDISLYVTGSAGIINNTLVVSSSIKSSSAPGASTYAVNSNNFAIDTTNTISTDAQNYRLTFTPTTTINGTTATGTSANAVITIVADEGAASNIATITGTLTSGSRSVERAVNVYANGSYNISGSTIVVNSNVTSDSAGQTVLATKSTNIVVSSRYDASANDTNKTLTITPESVIGSSATAITGTANVITLDIANAGSSSSTYTTATARISYRTNIGASATMTKDMSFYTFGSLTTSGNNLVFTSYIKESTFSSVILATRDYTYAVTSRNAITVDSSNATMSFAPSSTINGTTISGSANVAELTVAAANATSHANITGTITSGDHTVSDTLALYPTCTYSTDATTKKLTIISKICNNSSSSIEYATRTYSATVNSSNTVQSSSVNKTITLTPTTNITGLNSITGSPTVITLSANVSGDGSTQYAIVQSVDTYVVSTGTRTLTLDTSLYAVGRTTVSDNTLTFDALVASSPYAVTVYATKSYNYTITASDSVVADTSNYRLIFTPTASVAGATATGTEQYATLTIAASQGQASTYATITGTITSGSDSIDRAINVYAIGDSSITDNVFTYTAKIANANSSTIYASRSYNLNVAVNNAVSSSSLDKTITVTSSGTIGENTVTGQATVITLTSSITGDGSTDNATITARNQWDAAGIITLPTTLYSIGNISYSHNVLYAASSIASDSAGSTVYATKTNSYSTSVSNSVSAVSGSYSLRFTPSASVGSLNIPGTSSNAVLTIAAGSGESTMYAIITGTVTSGNESVNRSINVYAVGEVSVSGNVLNIRSKIANDASGTTIYASRLTTLSLTAANIVSADQSNERITFTPNVNVGTSSFTGTVSNADLTIAASADIGSAAITGTITSGSAVVNSTLNLYPTCTYSIADNTLTILSNVSNNSTGSITYATRVTTASVTATSTVTADSETYSVNIVPTANIGSYSVNGSADNVSTNITVSGSAESRYATASSVMTYSGSRTITKDLNLYVLNNTSFSEGVFSVESLISDSAFGTNIYARNATDYATTVSNSVAGSYSNYTLVYTPNARIGSTTIYGTAGTITLDINASTGASDNFAVVTGSMSNGTTTITKPISLYSIVSTSSDSNTLTVVGKIAATPSGANVYATKTITGTETLEYTTVGNSTTYKGKMLINGTTVYSDTTLTITRVNASATSAIIPAINGHKYTTGTRYTSGDVVTTIGTSHTAAYVTPIDASYTMTLGKRQGSAASTTSIKTWDGAGSGTTLSAVSNKIGSGHAMGTGRLTNNAVYLHACGELEVCATQTYTVFDQTDPESGITYHCVNAAEGTVLRQKSSTTYYGSTSNCYIANSTSSGASRTYYTAGNTVKYVVGEAAGDVADMLYDKGADIVYSTKTSLAETSVYPVHDINVYSANNTLYNEGSNCYYCSSSATTPATLYSQGTRSKYIEFDGTLYEEGDTVHKIGTPGTYYQQNDEATEAYTTLYSGGSQSNYVLVPNGQSAYLSAEQLYTKS